MADRDGSTPWRQGDILLQDQLDAIGLSSDGSDSIAIVATHDCDLARPVELEPRVEIILGRIIEESALDGAFTCCKSLRRLHTGLTAGGTHLHADLDASGKIAVPKELLLRHAPSTQHLMSMEELNTFQIWLAARYRRAAFSDEFNDRLAKVGVAERLPRLLKGSGYSIPAIFFDVDSGEDVRRDGPDDPHELVITLLYSTGVDPGASLAIAERAKSDIEGLFRARCMRRNEGGAEVWQWIELVDVEVVADTALSYAQSQVLKKWQADYVSLRTDPHQPVLGI